MTFIVQGLSYRNLIQYDIFKNQLQIKGPFSPQESYMANHMRQLLIPYG